MPVILAVGTQPNVFGEAVEVSRSGALWLVASDGVGHLVERIEPVGLLVHERLDPVRALGFDTGGNVDHHHGCGMESAGTDSEQTRAATHRRSDQDRLLRAD